ncbi:MAG: TetR/AcrR family transcriptional regulator [Myxococcota bacterium]
MARADTADATRDTRELLLAAALRAFSEKGFDGATARDIATDAGVNHGLIRYYFGDKMKLWRAAVGLAFSQLEEGLKVVQQDPSATSDRDRAGLLIRNYVRFVARHPEFVRLMHEEGKRKGPRMRWIVDHHVKPLFEAVVQITGQHGVLRGLPDGIAPVHFHYILAGSVGVIFHQAEECKRLTGVDPFDVAIVEDHARAIEFLLLGPEIEGIGEIENPVIDEPASSASTPWRK